MNNWIEIYQKNREYIQNKTGDYQDWYKNFVEQQSIYFTEVEKRLKKIREACASDEDFCNRTSVTGFDTKEVFLFDNKIMFVGVQHFLGCGYFWNVSDYNKLVHDDK